MHTFHDKENQDWPIDLTVGAVVRICAESEGRFDFFNPTKDELATQLADDLCLCWEALWFVCSPLARQRNLTAEQFGLALADDVLIAAQAALFKEWKEFFLRVRRQELALVVDKAAAYQAKKVELVQARLNDPLLTGLDERVSRKMETTLNESFGNLRQSLDSILDPSPPGSSTECVGPKDGSPAR